MAQLKIEKTTDIALVTTITPHTLYLEKKNGKLSVYVSNEDGTAIVPQGDGFNGLSDVVLFSPTAPELPVKQAFWFDTANYVMSLQIDITGDGSYIWLEMPSAPVATGIPIKQKEW